MRCLTLANHLRKEGASVQFITKPRPGNPIGMIRDQGFAVTPIGTGPGKNECDDVPFAEWEDPAWKADAEQTLAAINAPGTRVDWLVVDSYALDAEWEGRMRAAARRILAIDDLANRPHDCDAILDQNLHAEDDGRYDWLVPADCLRFIGPRYALLRPEFEAARRRPRTRGGTLRRILVFFGGSDPGNETEKAIDAIALLARRDLIADVVVGPANPHRARLESKCAGHSWVTLHCGVDDMAALMVRADLAIGAAGVAAWERCCLDLPSILITLATNQVSSAQALAARGGAWYLGRGETVTVEALASALRELVADTARVAAMSRAAGGLVDGRGTARIARALDPLPVTLRRAVPADREQVFCWRNDEETRRHSHDPAPIDPATHQRWFDEVLRSPNRILLIGERAGKPLGVLRYDCDGSRCTVSIYLVPGQHRRGYGPRLLLAGHQWLREHCPLISRINAEVLPENPSSAIAFQQAGYRLEAGVFSKRMESSR